MTIQEYFDGMPKEIVFEAYLKYLQDNGLIKEKLSEEYVYDILKKLLEYMDKNKIEEFRIDDYYDVYSPKEWILGEPLDDYEDAFDLIEEYFVGYRRNFNLFELTDWTYQLQFDDKWYRFERICGQGEVLRRIYVY